MEHIEINLKHQLVEGIIFDDDSYISLKCISRYGYALYWAILEDALKPADNRIKIGKYIN
jgi:hypothetical protein